LKKFKNVVAKFAKSELFARAHIRMYFEFNEGNSLHNAPSFLCNFRPDNCLPREFENAPTNRC
jgi:hypothetical protein